MVEIIRAELEDAETITDIKTRAYNQELQRYLGRNGGPKGYDKVESEIEIIHNCTAYKILSKGRIIGAFFLLFEGDSTVHFEDFVIEPEEQGKGIGFWVLQRIEMMYPEIRYWKLSTPVFSVGNQHLYEKAGYLEQDRDAELVFYCKYIEAGQPKVQVK